MKQHYIFFFILLSLAACKQSDPEDVLGRNGDVVYFSGQVWDVKIHEELVGPGPNYFSPYYDDVYVDELGYLHLKIAEHNGKWYATEVVGRDTIGYGTFTWVIQGDVENIPENIVVGLFTWDNESFFTQANSEVDIEFSRWGNIETENTLYYSVQPVNFGTYYPERSKEAETLPSDLIGVTTHSFTWTDTLIEWSSYKGEGINEANKTAYWSFDLDNPPRIKYENGYASDPIVIPAPGEATTVRINFWLLPWVSNEPTDGLTQEIVIRSFTYTPL